ncbi:MAG: pyruvate formate-lyase-activating protein [Negativicutes bacterium]|nr:pyruvate formate-lyase-activating protein [Negativicutes bacterium]
MNGYCHSRETFGTVDGRGIRYVLFLAGCSLGCVFCHNPDTWHQGGQRITVQEVLADYASYRIFYDASGGGITASGGEPLKQAEFVAALFAACRRENIHTTLDTAGYADAGQVKMVLEVTDEVLFGLKAVCPEVHRRITRADNARILQNLRDIAASGVPLRIRYILLPGINNRAEDLAALAALITEISGCLSLELLPYHTMGRQKWQRLGMPYRLAATAAATADDVERAKEELRRLGIGNLQ